MKAKLRSILVGVLSMFMLAVTPLAIIKTDTEKTPVTASAATSDVPDASNLALSKWDWITDQIGMGATTFVRDENDPKVVTAMHLDGLSSGGGPFATYQTNKLGDFKYSMVATMNLQTAADLGLTSAKEWDYSTFYISFMIDSNEPIAGYARPYEGTAYFSIAFEKTRTTIKICSNASCTNKGSGRIIQSNGKCSTCGGTGYTEEIKDCEVIRLIRNDNPGNTAKIVQSIIQEKTWYEGCEADLPSDKVGKHFANGEAHLFEFTVERVTSGTAGVKVTFYYDGDTNPLFERTQGNEFTNSYNESFNYPYSTMDGYLGFWTDSSLPMADAANECYVNIQELGIAPITSGTVGSYYTQAPKPDLPLTAKTYTTQASYPKGQEIEIALTDLFSYEGDGAMTYTAIDMNTKEAIGTIRNGYWVYTPMTGTVATVQVDATATEDDGEVKTATAYLMLNFSGDDIVVPSLDKPKLSLNENIASWNTVENAGSYEYRIGADGEVKVTSDTTQKLAHNETLYVRAISSNTNKYWHSDWSDPVTFRATTLGSPVLTLATSTNVVSWVGLAGASGYEYMIDGNENDIKKTTETRVGLSHGQSVQVRALGDDEKTLTGAWSAPVKYTAPSLNAPQVSVNGLTATWNAVANAQGYIYKIGESGQETTVEKDDSIPSVTLTHGAKLYVKALGNSDPTTWLDSTWGISDGAVAPNLSAPDVTIEGNVASWTGDPNATGYVYKIGANGEVKPATGTSQSLNNNGDTIYVMAKGDNISWLDSPWSDGKTYSANMLATPVVELNGNVASWEEVDGAVGYVYTFDNGATTTEVASSVLQVTGLTHNQSIRVKAKGNGTTSLDSNWSTAKKYTATALSKPVVTLSGNVASWVADPNASGYVYKIGLNGTVQPTEGTSVELKKGETIYVMAKGDNETWLDSNWSDYKTYTVTLLKDPVVTLSGNVASWEEVDGATKYVYKIGEDGAEQTATELSVSLTRGQTIYVKAVDESGAKEDSNWSNGKKYNAPSLDIPNVERTDNVVSWEEIANAEGYEIEINGESNGITTNFSVTLKSGQSVRVRAIDGDEIYEDSSWSRKLTFTAGTLASPTITLNGNEATWTSVTNAQGYVYKIGENGEETTVNEPTSVQLKHNETIYVMAVGNGETTSDSVCATKTYYAQALKTPTITMSGSVATWEAVDGASGYVYKIGENGDETTVEAGAPIPSVTLANGQTIYVMAKGNSETSLDSSWANFTYSAYAYAKPEVAFTTAWNIASWNEVEGADGYVYTINGGKEQSTTDTFVSGLEHGDVIKVKAVGASKNDSAWSDEKTCIAPNLSAPVVTIAEGSNVASWTEDPNASGYVYKIGGNGEVKSAEGTSVALNNGETIYVMAKGDNASWLDSAWSDGQTYSAKVLATPEVKIEGNEASWIEVDGAVGYVYTFDNGATTIEVDSSVLQVMGLTHNQSIRVKAVGDGVTTLDSNWSTAEKYTATALTKPDVTIEGNVASWTEDPNASGYVYKIGLNGTVQSAEGTSVELKNGETIYVMAKGDNETWLDSNWSDYKTYTVKRLTAPVVSLNGNVASWETVTGATEYVYKIGANGDETTVNEPTSVTLANGQTLYVKAVDGNQVQLASVWSKSETYVATTALDAPVVSLNGNVASWEEVEGANAYVYKLSANGAEQTTTELSVTLTHNQTLYVKAVDVNKEVLDSAWSEAVTYTTAALGVPTVTLDGNVAKWEEVTGAVNYQYRINRGNIQTTTETQVTLKDGETITVKAVGDNVTGIDGAWSETVTYIAPALTAPVVTLDGNVAKWEEVTGAVKYQYRINRGAIEETDVLQVEELNDGDTITVKAVGNKETNVDSAWSETVTYIAPALTAPVVTMNGNAATWTAVTGASGYVYKINGGAEQTTESLSVTLVNGDTIVVKAVGNKETNADSAWSEAVTYTLVTLGTPTVTLSGNVASWTAVEGASEYAYTIDNGEVHTTQELSVTLTNGQSIRVKAVGDNATYADSYWSATQTYVVVKLAKPVVTLSGSKASWTAVEGASKYAYKIGVNGDEETTESLSVTLEKNQTLYVKAVGDNVTYTDGDWSNAVTYVLPKLTAPTVTFEGNVATWTEVDDAIGYTYKIGADGAEITKTEIPLVALKHLECLYVKAKGNNETCEDSDWTITEIYVAPMLGDVTVTLDGNVASWVAVEGATAYVYKINGGEEQTTTETSIKLEDGQSIQVKAVGDGATNLDGRWSNAVSFVLDKGIYKVNVEVEGCNSIASIAGVTVMMLALGVFVALKRRGEDKQ